MYEQSTQPNQSFESTIWLSLLTTLYLKGQVMHCLEVIVARNDEAEIKEKLGKEMFEYLCAMFSKNQDDISVFAQQSWLFLAS